MTNDHGLPSQNFSEADNDAVVQSHPAVSMLKGDGKEASLANRFSAAVTGMFASGFAMEKASAVEPVQAQGQVPQVTQRAEAVAPPSDERREPKEKMSFLRKLGIGKDVSEGKDPHPELAENKGGFMSRLGGAAKSKTGGAEAMERPTGAVEAKTEAPGGCLGRLYGAVSSRMGPGNAAVKPPPPTLPDDVESMSNVQKVSPFSGLAEEKAAGASDPIPAEDTSAVPTNGVKAPGVVARAKEEVAAVGEAVKELVVGKKE